MDNINTPPGLLEILTFATPTIYRCLKMLDLFTDEARDRILHEVSLLFVLLMLYIPYPLPNPRGSFPVFFFHSAIMALSFSAFSG